MRNCLNNLERLSHARRVKSKTMCQAQSHPNLSMEALRNSTYCREPGELSSPYVNAIVEYMLSHLRRTDLTLTR